MNRKPTLTIMRMLFILTSVLSIISYTSKLNVDLEAEKSKILSLEKQQQEFHLKENAEEFVQMFSDQFVNVSRGSILTPSKIDSYERFNNYFKTVEFVKWDDVQEPIIRISDDASMAYSIIEKEVIVKYYDEESQVTDTTHFAWTTIYRKTDGEWEIDCVTSTNK